jgi:hypothetical protein
MMFMLFFRPGKGWYAMLWAMAISNENAGGKENNLSVQGKRPRERDMIVYRSSSCEIEWNVLLGRHGGSTSHFVTYPFARVEF